MKNFSAINLIYWSIPVLFFLSILTHFLYELSGNNLIFGLFFPVNESVFEHMKLFSVPSFLFWVITYLIKKDEIDADKWFTAGLISMVVTIVLIPMLHYLYSSSLATHIVWVDILIALLSVGFAHVLAAHYYVHGKGINYQTAIFLMIAVLIILAVLTLFPPKIPLFQSSETGEYGM